MEREDPITLEDHQTRFRVSLASTSDSGASRGSILNSRDAEVVLSYTMSRDVSLTVLSKNTSTSNTDEILEVDCIVLSHDGILEHSRYFVKLRFLRSEQTFWQFAISRLARGGEPYEPNLGCLITKCKRQTQR